MTDPSKAGPPSPSRDPAPSLASFRELLRERPDGLTFADLPGTVLEDLALGWSDGRPLARVAAELAARIDGIPAEGRDREIAGRALLTLLARRGAPVKTRLGAEDVRLLGVAALDSTDAEALEAWEAREREYRSLAELPSSYALDDYALDVSGAFAAARRDAPDAPPDTVGPAHPLALLFGSLPSGLRDWFARRYDGSAADVLAWKFVLVGRAIAHHRAGMLETGVLRALGEPDPAVPEALAAGLLAQDLGALARTAILDPV